MGQISILLYHQVGDLPKEYSNLDCYCQIENFYQQMTYLYEQNYEVISLDKAIEKNLHKEGLDKSYVVLTFDDGCKSFYNSVLPILRRYGFTATVYPVVGYLDAVAGWCKPLNEDLVLMSDEEIIELNNLGFSIGAHTVFHQKLDLLSEQEIIFEIQESKDYLEYLLGKSVNSFSYPHGRYNISVIKQLKKSGFTNAVTCNNNYYSPEFSNFELPRKYVTYFDDLNVFKAKL